LPTGFLQIPPRDGHPCPWLMVPTAKPIADFHRQAIAHAGRTRKNGLSKPFFRGQSFAALSGRYSNLALLEKLAKYVADQCFPEIFPITKNLGSSPTFTGISIS